MTQAAAKTEKQPQPKEALVIPFNAASLADSKRNTWEIDVPPGTHPDELLAPGAWAALSRNLHPKDLAYSQGTYLNGGAWLQIQRCRTAWTGGAQMVRLQLIDLPPVIDNAKDMELDGVSITLDEVNGWTVRLLKKGGLIHSCQRTHPHITSKEAARRHFLDSAAGRHGNS